MAAIDPLAQGADFGFAQRLSTSGRRHAVAGDLSNQKAPFGESFDDDRAAIASLERRSVRAQIEAGHRLPRSMALDTSRGEYGKNLFFKTCELFSGLFIGDAGSLVRRSTRRDQAFESFNVRVGNFLPVDSRR